MGVKLKDQQTELLYGQKAAWLVYLVSTHHIEDSVIVSYLLIHGILLAS